MQTTPNKCRTGVTDFDALLKAVKDIKNEKMSLRAAAKAYNIPRTSLGRYMTKINTKIPDISVVDETKLLKELRSITSYTKEHQVIQI